MEVEIRAGTREDSPILDTFDPFGGNRDLEIAEGRLWVAAVDGTVAGYLSTTRSGFIGHPFVAYLCVAENHRRVGIASALMDAIEKHQIGKRLFISTEEDNQHMLALLDQRGYVAAGDISGLNDTHSGVDERFFYKDV